MLEIWYNFCDMKAETKRYAVVDLEATTASHNAKIIQIGIVLIENGEIIQTYERDVNPHERIDEHIEALTGLTNDRLQAAPDFSQLAAEIYELVADNIFVAHNVQFDANLLAESLFWEGFDLKTPRIDTVELAQVFFPSLEKYNLGLLCQQLDIPLEKAHTALSDAYATALLFLKIQEKIKSLPRPLVEELLARSSHLLYESSLALEACLEEISSFSRSDLEDHHGIFLKKLENFPPSRQFAGDFAHNLALLGLDERPYQAAFAEQIEKGLKDGTPSFIQAPTGLGKTYGYLLPLLAKTKDQLVLALPTKALQDQLMKQEGDRIFNVFQTSFHSLKGPRNYIKLDAFYESLSCEDNHLLETCKMKLLVWLTETQTGDLEEIGHKYRYQAYFEEISHDGNLQATSLFQDCDFWQKNQLLADQSRVLVTNHAYLLTRLEDDKAFLRGKILVVDEAQKLYLTLEHVSRKSLNLTKILQEIQTQLQRTEDLLTKRILESLQFELGQASQKFPKTKQKELSEESCQKIRQDLQELPQGLLRALKDLFAADYQTFWLEEESYESHRTLFLQAARLDLPLFRDFLPEGTQVFFTSATLDISPRVSLAGLLGFENSEIIRLPDLSQGQQELWCDGDFPDVATLDMETYARLVAERLRDLSLLGHPILALFTSKDLLLRVSDMLALPHLSQYKNGDAANLKRRFDRGESQILLGTGSFWEGVDFAQQDHIIQVITRLPFDNPKDFLTQKINQKLKEEGKSSFYDYHLPLMLLRLKQAMGRTNRRPDQKSALVLLDNRLFSKSYSRQIQKSLAEITSLKEASFPQILAEVREFLE